MPTPNEDPWPWHSAKNREDFLTTADSRIGAVGALLELGQATLFRVDSFTVDESGVNIAVTHVPLPGFRPASRASCEIYSVWNYFSTDSGRWQARYCWKFLFGDVELQSVIMAGTEAAARGVVLTASQVLSIFKWHGGLDNRKEKNLGNTDLPGLMENLFKAL